MALLGEAHPRAKLTTEQVIMIRKLFKQGFSIPVIAKAYKVSTWNIKTIVKYKSWKHL